MSSTNDATQKARIIAALRAHPAGMTTWDLTMETRVLNLTGRISDLRDDGYLIEAVRVPVKRSVFRYRLIEQPVQIEAGL